jgi:glucose/arabinose dehydrogenase
MGVMLLASAAPAAAALPVTLVEGGFSQPLFVTHAGDSRLFVVEKGGLIKIVGGGTFLDISTKVSVSGERGLLGLAFDPNYATNGLFYVDYTRGDGDVVVAEYRRSSLDPDLADPSYERILMRIEHSGASNHNGGWIGFSGDSLFIAVGDAANGANAQSLNVLLGKILRINPDDPDGGGPKTYGIPGTNPYVGRVGMDEIWAYGFRNPWRCSHDRKKGTMWCGDVGQNAWEEIDRGPFKARNYGWPLLEGMHYYDYPNKPQGALCTTKCRTLPLLDYAHSVPGDDNNSVTGGYVSRRSGATLAGKYVFGDLGSGRVWAIPANFQRGDPMPAPLAQTAFTISSFGEGFDRRLYVVDIGGAVYRLSDS